MRHAAQLLLVTVLAAGCGGGDGYSFDVPRGFPAAPRVPSENPMSEAKVELGRHLFYDRRLSLDESTSCGSCHEQARAFTDGLARSEGITGDLTPRSAQPLMNIGYTPTLTWANPNLTSLEEQALVPIFGEDPIEMGMAGNEDLLLARLAADADYIARFAESFPGEADPISVTNVVRAIAAFERTLISGDSRADRYEAGDQSALTDEEVMGRDLFFSERLECFHCHGGFTFSSAVDHADNVFTQATFQNNGLYNLDGDGAYPEPNTGLHAFTLNPADQGLMRPPSLRNIAVTAPYMHDGSIETLEGVLDHYAAGGRNIEDGPLAGDGRDNPNKSIFVRGFILTEAERAAVLAYLRALTDEAFLADPRFSDPFAGE